MGGPVSRACPFLLPILARCLASPRPIKGRSGHVSLAVEERKRKALTHRFPFTTEQKPSSAAGLSSPPFPRPLRGRDRPAFQSARRKRPWRRRREARLARGLPRNARAFPCPSSERVALIWYFEDTHTHTYHLG